MMSKRIYLGDGLYAAFDGSVLILHAPRSDGEHWVALEPAILSALLEYVRTLPYQFTQCPLCGQPSDLEA